MNKKRSTKRINRKLSKKYQSKSPLISRRSKRTKRTHRSSRTKKVLNVGRSKRSRRVRRTRKLYGGAHKDWDEKSLALIADNKEYALAKELDVVPLDRVIPNRDTIFHCEGGLILKFIRNKGRHEKLDNEHDATRRLRSAGVEGISEILSGRWSADRQVYAQVMKIIPNSMDLYSWKEKKRHEMPLWGWNESEFEADTIQIFKKILTILEKIHEAGWAHRDLKLDNIMITPAWSSKEKRLRPDFDITIIDFEFACYAEPRGRLTSALFGEGCSDGEAFLDRTARTQTRGYFGPEIYGKRMDVPQDGQPRQIDWKAVDMYTIGVNLYTFCVDEFPFRVLHRATEGATSGARGAALDRAVLGLVPEEQDVNQAAALWERSWAGRSGECCSNEIKSFIMECLSDKPEKRPTASEALQRPMFTPTRALGPDEKGLNSLGLE